MSHDYDPCSVSMTFKAAPDTRLYARMLLCPQRLERRVNGLRQRQDTLAIEGLGLLLYDLVSQPPLLVSVLDKRSGIADSNSARPFQANILTPASTADFCGTLSNQSEQHRTKQSVILTRLDERLHPWTRPRGAARAHSGLPGFEPPGICERARRRYEAPIPLARPGSTLSGTGQASIERSGHPNRCRVFHPVGDA